MIPMSTKEIKDFWHGFCERQKVPADLRAKGDQKIDEDPEHWADHTMWELLDAVKK
jgi:hypothetical protein